MAFEFSLSLAGLGVIVAAWVLEFFFMGKRKKISPFFIGVYILGVGILVYDGFTSGNILLAVANLVSLAVAGIVLGKTLVETKD
jgi:ABC-type thiamin/hydroxymethylpyrimidine transport system permease subunit